MNAHIEDPEKSGKSDPALSLLTAAPLVEALTRLMREFDIVLYALCRRDGILEGYKPENNNKYLKAKKALTQAEAIIQHSEAIWRVVRAAMKVSQKYAALADWDKAGLNFDFNAALEELHEVVDDLPTEVLAMGEGVKSE